MFDPIRVLKVLARHGVRFVIIGGYAGRFWGSNSITNDLDICYARDRKNFEALASALRELDARLRGAPSDVPFLLDARTLEMGDHFTFETNAGNLDCLGTPRGSQGYLDLISGATTMDLEGIRVSVVALEDLIRLKSAAGRPKDRAEVEILAALRDEIERRRPEALKAVPPRKSPRGSGPGTKS